MQKFGRAQPVRRLEDRRFLTGQGAYVDDCAPEGALHGVFYRSPLAHAEIASLHVEEARHAPGVVAVLTAGQLEAAGILLGMEADLLKTATGRGADPERPILARSHVRFVGEPVALVVAESRQAAEDAMELIEAEYDDLDVKVDVAPGGPLVHAEAPGNVAYDWERGDRAALDAAIAGAAHVVRTRIEDNRVIANPMEPRGAWAEWDGKRLHLCFSGQGVWDQRDKLARHLDLDPAAVRVTTPDVGGGFGMKGQTYPESYVIGAAAMLLGRPVRWMSGRTEGMLSDNAGRDLVSETVMAFDADYRLIGYGVETLSNLGAYNSEFGQNIQASLFQKVLPGVYDFQTYHLHVRGIYTNTAQVDAYRGAGRPEAILAIERSMDNAARQMGVDPWELRRRNFIAPEKFPYRSATGESYDVGDFRRLLDRIEVECDRAGYAARQAASAAAGKLRGLGLAYYIESILGRPSEDVKIDFHEDGTVSIYVGTQSNGQGHETVYATFLADQTGIPLERIRVVQGDSDLIPDGGGTGGSRSVTVQTNVTLVAVADITAAFRAFLAAEHGVAAEEIVFDDESFRIPGSNEAPGMIEVAAMARKAGRTDLLSFAANAKLDGRSYPNGAHVAEIEIDPATGVLEVLRYTVVDDLGNLINPMLVEGQIQGGVAQGIGQAVSERVVYDEGGQLLTASFMDYGMPRADGLPMVDFTSVPVPSTRNPMGMKGCGEAGTVGALGAMANAVADALAPLGAEAQMPFTPHRLWSAIRAAQVKAVAAE